METFLWHIIGDLSRMAKMCPISIENAFGTQSGTLHNKKRALEEQLLFPWNGRQDTQSYAS